jgi:hypothetical protein
MKKYYAHFDLYFEEMKYSIVGPADGKKKDLVDSITDFAKQKKMTCNLKTKKLFIGDKEVGSFEITSQTI